MTQNVNTNVTISVGGGKVIEPGFL